MRKKKKWLSLLAIAASTSMIFFDSTVLPVAIPTIQRELSVSSLQLQWMINAYPLAIASLALTGGRVGDLFGHRRIFCMGLLIFAIASAIGGMATFGLWLVMARALQGIGGALMGPAALSLMIQIFDDKERGRALGSVVAISSLFLSLGPFLGGFFTQFLSWRILFWINLPIALIGVALALSVIPRSSIEAESFDFFGGGTLVVGLVSLILIVMNGRHWGWISWQTGGLGLLFLISLVLFPLLERRSDSPLFDWGLWRNRGFLGGNLLVMTTQALLMMTVYWAIYFQNILDFSPLQAGCMTLIATLPIIVFAPVGGHLYDRFGPHFPIQIGFALVIFGFCWFLIALRNPEPLVLAPGLFAFGAGVPLILTPTSTTTLSSVPDKKRGAASGIYNTMRYVGATLGIALLGSVIDATERSRFIKLLKTNHLTQDLDPKSLLRLAQQGGQTIESLSQLNPLQKQSIQDTLDGAGYFAYTVGTATALCMAVVGLFISYIYFNKLRSRN